MLWVHRNFIDVAFYPIYVTPGEIRYQLEGYWVLLRNPNHVFDYEKIFISVKDLGDWRREALPKK